MPLNITKITDEFAAALVVMAMSLSVLGQAAGGDTELRDKTIEEVKKAGGEWVGAVAGRDEAALNRLLADGYIFTHSTGDVTAVHQARYNYWSNAEAEQV